jgi:uncharacterized membrane protein HdeD (DUF308 family)
VSTTEATNQTTRRVSVNSTENLHMHLFLTRGLLAIAWAAVFAAASNSVRAGVTVGAGVLLVLYPLIDVAGCLMDARTQHGSARQLLLANAAVSATAAVALGVAATGSVANVLAVFGVWAAISGAAQLVVALRRRALLGNQWPLLLAGGLSIVAGIAYLILSAGHDPKLRPLVLYTATGGVEFVVQAWLLERRRRRLGTLTPRSSAQAANHEESPQRRGARTPTRNHPAAIHDRETRP